MTTWQIAHLSLTSVQFIEVIINLSTYKYNSGGWFTKQESKTKEIKFERRYERINLLQW